MSSQKLITLYTQLLDTAGLSVTSDGCVSVKPLVEGEEARPFTVKGKRLVLPTTAHLKNPTQKTVVFHPLLENLNRGESEVFAEYRKALVLRVNLAVIDLIQDLLILTASPSQHNVLNPDQTEVLSILKGANNKTVEAFRDIVEKIPTDQLYRRVVKFFMKPSGKVGDKAYTRLGVVSFPLYEALCKDEKVEGVKLADKHREILKKAFEYVLPNLDKAHEYSRGSNSHVAPMFDAMMQAMSAVFQPISAIQRLFTGTKIPDLFENTYSFSSDWWEDMQNLDALLVEVRKVPMQPGNEGNAGHHAAEDDAVEPVKKAHPSVSAAIAAQAAPAAPQQHHHQTHTAHQHVAHQPAAALPPIYQQQPAAPAQNAGRPTTFAERLQAAQQRPQQGNQGQVTYVQTPNGPMPVQQVMVRSSDPYAAPQMAMVPVGQPAMQPGYPQPGYPQPGYPQPGYMQPGMQQAAPYPNAVYPGQVVYAQPGMAPGGPNFGF